MSYTARSQRWKVIGVKRLLILALIIGAATAVAKMAAAKKAEWAGLTEPQVREKLDSTLPSRVPDEKRGAIADQVVSKMRDQGMLREQDDAAAPTDETDDTTAGSTEATADTGPDDTAG